MKHEKKRRWWVGGIVGLVFLLGLWVLWPVKLFLHPGFWFSRTLVVFMNEAEARPCGGFVSAFGTFRPLWPSWQLTNSYAFEGRTFGPASYPLDRVSADLHFWDLGTALDTEVCAQTFADAYQQLTGKDVGRVVLVNTGIIEDLLETTGPFTWKDQKLYAETIFAFLTRSVADVDRHDEEALKTRKTPLAQIGKKLVWRSLWRPWKWRSITRFMAQQIDQGTIYVQGVSEPLSLDRESFSLVEWNLGGAKTSRFLQKNVTLFVRERKPHKWDIDIEVEIYNAGGIDEPLSQTWRGVLALQLPEDLGGEELRFEPILDPGEHFKERHSYRYEGALEQIALMVPRGQEVLWDVNISLFPQKQFLQTSFPSHENVGHFLAYLNGQKEVLSWNVHPDRKAPFITLHEGVSWAHLPVFVQRKWGNLFAQYGRNAWFVEIHTNEKIAVQEAFSAALVDRNITDTEQDVSPEFLAWELLEDERTLTLFFAAPVHQPEERFAFSMSGVTDFFGNALQKGPRTVIDRRK